MREKIDAKFLRSELICLEQINEKAWFVIERHLKCIEFSDMGGLGLAALEMFQLNKSRVAKKNSISALFLSSHLEIKSYDL